MANDATDLKPRVSGTAPSWEAPDTRWGRYLTTIERDIILEAEKSCGTPTTALDVGAAGGRWSALLAGRGWDIACTDVNSYSLELVRENVPQAKRMLVDPRDTTLPCGDDSVGMLLCIEVFHVVSKAWFISEAARIVKPNGLVVAVFANKYSWRGYAHHMRALALGRFDYYSTPYAPWRRAFRGAGFRMLREEGLCWFPFSRSSDSPLVPTCTSIESRIGLRRLPAISPWIVFVARKEP